MNHSEDETVVQTVQTVFPRRDNDATTTAILAVEAAATAIVAMNQLSIPTAALSAPSRPPSPRCTGISAAELKTAANPSPVAATHASRPVARSPLPPSPDCGGMAPRDPDVYHGRTPPRNLSRVHKMADEVGTLQSLPAFRVQEFRAACRAARFPFNAGASLRRHHVKYRLAADLRYTRGMDHHQVDRLGRQEDIKGAADAFEDVVREFLEELGLHFWDEHHQKARWQEEVKQWTQRREDMFMRSPHTKHDTDVLDRPPLCPPTPDFILPTPIYIQGRRTSIHWIEVKHFYGATTIPTDGSVRHAICSLVPKARQYLDTYGPGAYIFAYGVGEGMVHALAQLQELSNTKNHVSSQDENPVIVLDSSHMKMDRVHRQLSRW
eukprot:CAMPEP_0113303012 /NCGR_PEP_ID=MMETSP0010_2-20120614/3605_1 /TAXON_ID=216773 ORGANISM="Corethron hystrix, Strain 308" /NCGR_SAMPLE_ID=MMETSP0010_2 /ASSEMBLY_ACC=CAM_ASM_000155 /LENGTH=379 /DNA_ID=CAMNT_0000156937 /DNA_START=66 /DNA_END=1204 /DNA_ORIENTATION=+ /assembly_acc=CAM_ASM_000155